MHQNKSRIPRWLVENDPSWEKSIDSDLGLLKWVKKGTGIQAVCQPTSIFCDILGQDENHVGLLDIANSAKMSNNAPTALGMGDITKYLSSRYLNPGINGPRFDLRKSKGF